MRKRSTQEILQLIEVRITGDTGDNNVDVLLVGGGAGGTGGNASGQNRGAGGAGNAYPANNGSNSIFSSSLIFEIDIL